MSVVAELIESRQGDLVHRWAAHVRQRMGLQGGANVLDEARLAGDLRALVGYLRGRDASPVSGPDVLAFLPGVVWALLEEARCPASLAEVRVVTDFVAQASTGERLEDTRLQRLIEHAPAIVCTLNGPRHVFALVNPVCQQLVGRDRHLVGLSVQEALPETVAQGFVQLLDQVYATGEPFVGREVRLQLDEGAKGPGEEHFLHFVFQPRRDARGQVEGIDAFGFEVTDQVRARQRAEALSERLRESEERMLGLAQAAGAGFFELYAATGRLTADARVYALLGLVPGAPLTLELVLQCVYAEDRERLTREISTLLSEPSDAPFIITARVVGLGTVPLRWVESRGQRRQDSNGRPMLVGALLDVTARKEAEASSQALLQALGQSETRYRLATRATKDAIWDWNLVTNHVTWNEGLREQFGHTSEQVRPDGDWWMEHIHPADRERVSGSIHAVIDAPAGHDWQDDYRFQRRDGSWAFVTDRGWVSRDESGAALRMVGAMQDVTERREGEFLRLRQSRHFALSARVGLAISRGTVLGVMLQECAEALVGELEVVLARIWLLGAAHEGLELGADAGLSPPGEGPYGRAPPTRSTLDRIARERQPLFSQALGEDPRVDAPEWCQREGLVAFAGLPLFVGDKPVGVMALFSRQPMEQDTLDILKQVSDGIAQGVERLRAEDALRTRVDFEQKLIGIVSHDLRNPLNAITLGTAVLVQRQGLDERATRSVLRIQSSAERATRMVKDLLDFTQARLGGGIHIETRPVDLREVVGGVLEEVRAAEPTRVLDVRHEGDGQGTWDADRLAQVVQNLVTNALKYSPGDSRVRIATRAEGGAVSLTVSNGGAPIPASKLSSIFEPMQRATAEVDKVGRSVGLGLYIVKSIVEAHGGSIAVSSTQAEGTTFTVRLPRQRP